MRWAAIVNSAQTRSPRGADRWVGATVSAVRWCAQHGYGVISSVGLNTWELTLWQAAAAGTEVWVVAGLAASADGEALRAEIVEQFGLDQNKTRWTWLAAGPRSSRDRSCRQRDRRVLEMADMVLPISVKKGGRMEEAIRQVAREKVDSRFSVGYRKERRRVLRWNIGQVQPGTGRDLGLLHLTRAAGGKWPGEKAAAYYEQLARSGEADPRSAFETLRRILREGRIRGSSWQIAGGRDVVCWTALAPAEALALVRPRKRFARWAFEPYGVWVSAAAALQLGARPVEYVTGRAKGWYEHAGGADGGWEREREWRTVGDVDLTRLEPEQVRVWTATEREASILRREVPWQVQSFGMEPR